MKRFFLTQILFLVILSSCGNSEESTPTPTSQATDISTTTTIASTTTTTTSTTTTTTSTTTTTTTLAPKPPSISDLLDAPYPLNIAHAGGDQDYPHSTMYAFQQAVIEGADILEMDVRITADGVLVVHHDETVDGNTGVSGTVS